MRKVSKARERAQKLYNRSKIEYKESITKQAEIDPELIWCPVALSLWNEKLPREDIHHTCGRAGSDLYDKDTFMWISRKAHEWIGANGREAEKRGWLNPRRHISKRLRINLPN